MPPTNAPFYRERRHRRRPAASCRRHFLRLGGSRIEYSRGPQLLEGIGKQGRREGDFPIAKESLSKPRFRRRLQSCGPKSLIEQRLFLIRMSANVRCSVTLTR